MVNRMSQKIEKHSDPASLCKFQSNPDKADSILLVTIFT